ncbi:MAG: patatin-like phospholipase family protein [Burkholderiales bacterium]|nr:patatin-like phospholipase family protein [Burkholderiales bacterium]
MPHAQTAPPSSPAGPIARPEWRRDAAVARPSAPRRHRLLAGLAFAACLGGCALRTPVPPVSAPVAAPPAASLPAPAPRARPKVALALGGGAARGFAHIGVIKVLEQHGIAVDLVAGTSAGSVVGALYAAGHDGFALQRMALAMEEGVIADWSISGISRGVLKGELLEHWINERVRGRAIERMARPFAIVATDLATGEAVVFRSGNTGIAVHASSAVPGAFRPVRISGREYVDGGLTHPVPVRAARAMGADIVIAVDVSQSPRNGKPDDLGGILLQTFAIMGRAIARGELAEADVVIRPQANQSGTDFAARHEIILEGERAALAALPGLRERLARAAGS